MNKNITTNNIVTWDYTDHAAHYDKRADYSNEAIKDLINIIGMKTDMPIGDIGAGTGKLTKELLKFGLKTLSVEPNDEMRKYGIQNTQGQHASWSKGTGEHTGLNDNSVYASLFGSSFNVVDQHKTLDEVIRITQPRGWFACMWNHRDLNDTLQKQIEDIIKYYISGYSYGLRRQDPSDVIHQHGKFGNTIKIEGIIDWQMSKQDIITAWKSHATLRRQSGSDNMFDNIITSIEKHLIDYPDMINVPYVTRIYVARIL